MRAAFVSLLGPRRPDRHDRRGTRDGPHHDVPRWPPNSVSPDVIIERVRAAFGGSRGVQLGWFHWLNAMGGGATNEALFIYLYLSSI